MSDSNKLDKLLNAARAELDDPARTTIVGAGADATPRFELFHAGLSMCSQKVRAVLAEKAIPYTSHELGSVAISGSGAEDFGDPLNVEWTVRNDGSDMAIGSWVDRIYLSTDNVHDAGDLLVAAVDARG